MDSAWAPNVASAAREAWDAHGRRAQVVGAAGLTFWAGLGSAQLLGGAMGLSCAAQPLSGLFGFGAVCASAQAAERVVVVAGDVPAPSQPESIGYTVASVALFQQLGGHFSAILPSDVLQPGAFAHESVPATKAYADTAKRELLVRIGRRFGCHTCGSRRAPSTFFADHMPPLKVVTVHSSGLLGWFRPALTQRFFPQCRDCSKAQSHVARRCSTSVQVLHLVYHLSSPRAYHATALAVASLLLLRQEQERDKAAVA